MCQATIYMEDNGHRELVLSEVISMERCHEGWRVHALLEEPRVLNGEILSIDFLKHTVVLKVERQ